MSRSDQYEHGSNTFVSFLATILLSFIIVYVTIAVGGALSGDDLILDMFLNVIDVLPYGNAIAEFAFTLISGFLGTTVNYTQGMFGSDSATFLYLVQEFCKLCLSAGIFPALNEFLQIICGVKNESGIWNFLKSIVITMLCGYLAAFFAGLALEFLFTQVQGLPRIAQGILSGGVSLGIIGGVFMIVKLLFFSGGSMLAFTLYYLIRYVLLNIIKIMIVYLMILSTFILILWGNIGAFITSMGGLFVLLIMVIGFDIMLKSAFDFGD